MRRELSWKKQDLPYSLMDVLASTLSDQLSCWLYQGVQREWQINYRNEASLFFLSWRAAVWQLCVPLICLLHFPFSAGMSLVPCIFFCFFLSIHTNLLKRNTCCLWGRWKAELLLSENVIESVVDSQSKSQAPFCLSTHLVAFRPFSENVD